MRPVALSYFLLVLALACGGLGTTSSVAPVSPTAPTTPTEAADHRPATHAAPAEVEVLPEAADPPDQHGQPEVFDPAEHPDTPYETVPAVPDLELRLFRFDQRTAAPDDADYVLEVRREGQRTALYTHLDPAPILAPDGRTALVQNVVQRPGGWVRQTRLIDLVDGSTVRLPNVGCLETDIRFLGDGSVIGSEEHSITMGGMITRCRVLPDGTVAGAVRFDPIGIGAPSVAIEPLRQDPPAELLLARATCSAELLDYRTGTVVRLEHPPVDPGDDFECPWFDELARWTGESTFQSFPRSFPR